MLLQNLKNASPSRKSTGGFTLVELLVVIVVIGLLAAIAVPIFLSQSDKANDAALKSDLSNAARMLQVAEASGVTLPSSLPAGQVTDLGAAGTITPAATLTVSGSGASLCVEGTSDSGDVYSADLANGLRNYDCAGNANGQSPLALSYGSSITFSAANASELPVLTGAQTAPMEVCEFPYETYTDSYILENCTNWGGTLKTVDVGDMTFSITGGALPSYVSLTTTGLSAGKLTFNNSTAQKEWNATVVHDTTSAYATNIGSGNQQVQLAFEQPDGKVILISRHRYTMDKTIYRLNADGTSDTTFNTNTGNGPHTGNGYYNPVRKVETQPDGKILLSGEIREFNGGSAPGVMRLNSDGSPDTAFNSNALTSVGGGGADFALLPDGKLVVRHSSKGYLRLNADGTLDATLSPPVTDNYALLWGQSDGKVLSFNGTTLTRWDANGTVDGTFTNSTFASNSVKTIVEQSDGKLLVGGYFTSLSGTTVKQLVRLNSDGTPDTAFNANIVSASLTMNNVEDIYIQPSDGAILVTGGGLNPGIQRFNADGTPDTAFNTSISNITLTRYEYTASNNSNVADVRSFFVEPTGKIVTISSSQFNTVEYGYLAVLQEQAPPGPPGASTIEITATDNTSGQSASTSVTINYTQ